MLLASLWGERKRGNEDNFKIFPPKMEEWIHQVYTKGNPDSGERALIDYNFYFCDVNIEIFMCHLIAEVI